VCPFWQATLSACKVPTWRTQLIASCLRVKHSIIVFVASTCASLAGSNLTMSVKINTGEVATVSHFTKRSHQLLQVAVSSRNLSVYFIFLSLNKYLLIWTINALGTITASSATDFQRAPWPTMSVFIFACVRYLLRNCCQIAIFLIKPPTVDTHTQ